MSFTPRNTTRRAQRGVNRHPVVRPLHTLRSVYGELVLGPGTVLYHASDVPFTTRTDKPMLFTTFHPSEYEMQPREYLTRITLKREVSLLYMMEDFVQTKIMPVLDKLSGRPGQNLSKRDAANIACYATHLDRNEFDGWISTINGKTAVEVALLNQDDIFEVTSPSEQIRRFDWKNVNIDDSTGEYIPKVWGTKFPISVVNPIFHLNSRLRTHIDAYIAYCMAHAPNENTFQIILMDPTTTIRYHDAPFAYITWGC
jgi:hypothetical protein